jgi:sigma-B regulation protein RsbU (phosphoserine phosphatase)
MTVERLGLARLGSIVAPFDVSATDGSDGAGISLAIEDPDGRVLAVAGAPGTRGTKIEVQRTIEAGGRTIGRVVGRGTTDPTLLEALVGSVAAGLMALAELSDETIARSDRAAATAVRLEAELTLGRRIQRSLIPLVPPAIPGYEVASHYEAAREVGGDFFDVFRIRGRAGRVAICIADVTGKGIAAALLMAFTRPLLHAAVDNLRTPAAALEQTNRILVEERRSSLFITGLCATVELRRGIVRLANAGHEPPLLVPADGGPISWLEGSGPLLGAFARLDLVERVVPLAPGDLIVFYTDGVTDAQAPSGLRFGDDRLIEALESARGGTASDAVEAICDAYHRFQADQPNADDVAIVALRRAPRQRSVRGGAAR